MFRSKIFWGLVLGVITSVLIFEGRIYLGYSHLWTRVIEVISVPGTHFANSIFPSGVPEGSWGRFYGILANACNFLIYALFWSVFFWIIGYFRERRHPYDRESTLVPPSFR